MPILKLFPDGVPEASPNGTVRADPYTVDPFADDFHDPSDTFFEDLGNTPIPFPVPRQKHAPARYPMDAATREITNQVIHEIEHGPDAAKFRLFFKYGKEEIARYESDEAAYIAFVKLLLPYTGDDFWLIDHIARDSFWISTVTWAFKRIGPNSRAYRDKVIILAAQEWYREYQAKAAQAQQQTPTRRTPQAAIGSYKGRKMTNVVAEAIAWAWRPRIPYGMVTILEGDPDQGKSLLTLDLAARLSRGDVMPDGSRGDVDGPVAVLIMTAEDSPEHTVRPRLEAAKADLDNVQIFDSVIINGQEEPPELPRDVGVLGQYIRDYGIRFVVIDVLMAYLEGDVKVLADQDIRRAIRPLAKLAREENVAIVVIRHLTKGGGNNPVYRGGGSIGLTGAARSVLLAGLAPDQPGDVGELHLLARVKGNLAPPYPSIGYVIEAVGGGSVPKLWWDEEEHQVTAADILKAADARARATADTEEDSPALTFLKETLSDGQAHPVEEVEAAGKKLGLTYKDLWRASKKLALDRRQKGFRGPWMWTWKAAPPEDGDDADEDDA